MKAHYVYAKREIPAADGSNYDRVQVGLDVVVGDAVMELIESGIDEDAHFWGTGWDDIDDDELEFAINDSTTMLKLGEYIRPMLVGKLREVLEDRKQEHAKHPKVG